MIIKELNLKNFGKFSNKSFCFCDGINVIYGPNEAGKTTIYTAIGAMLFGLDKQRGRAAKNDRYAAYQPWENKTWYEAGMKFETGGKVFSLERNFYQGEKSARLICETDGEELSVEQGDLEMLLGEINSELFFNTVAVGQLKIKPNEIVYNYLQNYIAGALEAGSNAVDVVKALELLEQKKKELERQRKKKILEVQQLLAKSETKLEMIEKEIGDCQMQLETLRQQKMAAKEAECEEKRGFFARFLQWLKQLFCRRRLREEARAKQEETLKYAEKEQFLRELSGEKESLKEELILERDAFYEKLHEQSKEEEIKAIDLAMKRIQELSAVCREEIMEKLLKKASEVLCKMTKGKYQKVLLEEDMQTAVWDGSRKLKLFQVSTGCGEQVYLSLRIALQDLFFEEDSLPLIFDDAFVYFDDKRLERLLSYLAELDRQVIIFSCHKRELRILEKLENNYQKILL